MHVRFIYKKNDQQYNYHKIVVSGFNSLKSYVRIFYTYCTFVIDLGDTYVHLRLCFYKKIVSMFKKESVIFPRFNTGKYMILFPVFPFLVRGGCVKKRHVKELGSVGPY